MGAIVGFKDKDKPLDWMTIDGQQRLITLCLVFAAIRDETSDTDLANTIDSRYLKNSERQYKVKPRGSGGPSPNDQVAFEKVMAHKQRRKESDDLEEPTAGIPSGLVREAYLFFRSKVQSIEQGNPESVVKLAALLLENLSLTEITLDEDDDPHSIFETLNNTGRKITPAACLRNYFFLKTMGGDANEIMDRWSPIEQAFRNVQKKGKEDPLTNFCHHYFMMTEEKYFPEDQLYFEVQRFIEKAIKERRRTVIEEGQATLAVILEFLHHMGVAAEAYRKVTNPHEELDREVRDLLAVIHEIEESPSVPLRLSAYVRWASGEMPKSDLLDILKSLENFLMRRHVCGIRSKNGGEETKFMPSLCGLSPADVRQRLAKANYPTDRQFRDNLRTANIGGGKNKRIGRLINKRWEEKGRDIIALDAVNSTLEHVLPQDDSVVWRVALGSSYESAADFLHTLGNTCLLSASDNSKSGTKPFAEKKLIYAQSSHSSARLAGSHPTWNEDTIQKVATEKIDDLLRDTWPHLDPQLEEDQNAEQRCAEERHIDKQHTRGLFADAGTLDSD
jgi:uncharacterized protein with ParB-like and HNH nuclease domain